MVIRGPKEPLSRSLSPHNPPPPPVFRLHLNPDVPPRRLASPLPPPPGLRALQGRTELEALVKQVKATRDRMLWGPKVRGRVCVCVV